MTLQLFLAGASVYRRTTAFFKYNDKHLDDPLLRLVEISDCHINSNHWML